MEALTAKAALVDPATLDDEGNAVTTRIPRSEIEEAARAKGPSEFFLDVARVRDGDREAEQRITVSWDPDDLDQLLRSATGDEVTLAFKPDELARMFEEPDVEAQGLREKVAILTVAATTAAGISAGVAGAQTVAPVGDAGGGSTAAFVTDSTSSGPASDLQAQEHAFRVSEESTGAGGTNLVTDTTSSGPGASTEASGGTQFLTDATSSGPGATEEAGGTQFLTDATSSGPGATEGGTGGTQFLTDATSSGPGATEQAGGQFLTDATSSGPGASTEAASAGGGGQSWVEGTGGEAALAGGLALLIVGAGFIGTRQRRGVQPA